MAGIIRILKFIENMQALKQNKAQHLAEYAILIGLVVAAAAGMAVYLQKGLQARYRGSVLNVRKELRILKNNPSLNIFYEPYYLKYNSETIDSSDQLIQFHPPLSMPGETRIKRERSRDMKSTQETLSGNYAD